MHILFIMFFVVIYILIAILLCFIILIQKPEGTITISTSKEKSSRSENAILVKTTIVIAFIFFSLAVCSSVYAEKYKKQVENDFNL